MIEYIRGIGIGVGVGFVIGIIRICICIVRICSAGISARHQHCGRN